MSCSSIRESLVLALLLIDWTLKVVVLVSWVSDLDMIARVASSATHRSAIVSCKVLLMSPCGCGG